MKKPDIKYALYAIIPLVLVLWVAFFLFKNNTNGLISLVLLLALLGVFINLFVQLWRVFKSIEKDPELKESVNQRMNSKSLLLLFIIYVILGWIIGSLFKHYNINPTVEWTTYIILAILFYFLYKWLSKNK